MQCVGNCGVGDSREKVGRRVSRQALSKTVAGSVRTDRWMISVAGKIGDKRSRGETAENGLNRGGEGRRLESG